MCIKSKCFSAFLLLIAISCVQVEDVVKDNDDYCFAVSSGKLIKTIRLYGRDGYCSYEWNYSYDENGRVASVDLSPYQFDYEYSEGLLNSISGITGFEWNLKYDQSNRLEKYALYFEDENVMELTFAYSYDRLSECQIDGFETFSRVSYTWDDGNMAERSFQDGVSHQYSYSDIIDNFNVPVPYLTNVFYGIQLIDPLLSGYTGSRNLASKIKIVNGNDGEAIFKEIRYERNAENDIIRIEVEGGGIYEIDYYT